MAIQLAERLKWYSAFQVWASHLQVLNKEHTGHHHLLVDQQTLPEAGLPMGDPPLHFGKGQTETELTLEPGTHTLQLILGNHLHVPHNPPVVSEKITITVTE